MWAEQGYTGAFAEWLHATRGWHLEVVRHPARQAWRTGRNGPLSARFAAVRVRSADGAPTAGMRHLPRARSERAGGKMPNTHDARQALDLMHHA